MNYRLARILIRLLPVFLLVSCKTGLYYATRFVAEEEEIHVLLLPPPGLITTFLPHHPDSVPGEPSPAIDQEKVRFVHEVDDSAYVRIFMESIRHHLGRFYVRVYGPDQMDAFNELDTTAFIFRVAQLELLEYIARETFVGRIRSREFRETVELTFLENNVWFEFSRTDEPDIPPEVLYSAFSTSDYIDGRFVTRRETGETVFVPEAYLLGEEDVRDLAYLSGRQNAQHIFDHLLNTYVAREMDEPPPYYYHYDLRQHTIREQLHPGFIRIGSAETQGENQP